MVIFIALRSLIGALHDLTRFSPAPDHRNRDRDDVTAAQAAADERALDRILAGRVSTAATSHEVPVYFHVVRTRKGKTGDYQ